MMTFHTISQWNKTSQQSLLHFYLHLLPSSPHFRSRSCVSCQFFLFYIQCSLFFLFFNLHYYVWHINSRACSGNGKPLNLTNWSTRRGHGLEWWPQTKERHLLEHRRQLKPSKLGLEFGRFFGLFETTQGEIKRFDWLPMDSVNS